MILVFCLSATLRELAFTEIREIVPDTLNVFSPDDTASRVLGVLKEAGLYEAAVAMEASVGIITVRDMLDVDQPSQTKIEGIWRGTGSVSPDGAVLDAAEALVRNNIRAAPITERGRVVGMVSQVDIVNAMCRVPELSGYAAKELIRSPVWSLDVDERVSHARRLMLERGISHIPIVEHGKLVGVVTAKDIVHTFITPASKTTTGERVGRRTSRFPGNVMGIMDPHPLSVRQDASVLEVACSMRDQGKGVCFMVGERGEIRGVLTPRELMAPLLRLRAVKELPVYIMGLSDEAFFERGVAEEKVRRVARRGMRFRPDITEVSVNIKTSQTRGNRTRYELTGRALTPDGQINAKAGGWDLLRVFDELCDTLDKAIGRTKPETPGRTRRRRSRR
jgi:predicted transcriptional regulator/ribosome-associated translation inhibitor RaiA